MVHRVGLYIYSTVCAERWIMLCCMLSVCSEAKTVQKALKGFIKDHIYSAGLFPLTMTAAASKARSLASFLATISREAMGMLQGTTISVELK